MVLPDERAYATLGRQLSELSNQSDTYSADDSLPESGHHRPYLRWACARSGPLDQFLVDWFVKKWRFSMDTFVSMVDTIAHCTETEKVSGWQPWYFLETLKASFNVSSEYQGCRPEDLSVSVRFLEQRAACDMVTLFVWRYLYFVEEFNNPSGAEARIFHEN